MLAHLLLLEAKCVLATLPQTVCCSPMWSFASRAVILMVCAAEFNANRRNRKSVKRHWLRVCRANIAGPDSAKIVDQDDVARS